MPAGWPDDVAAIGSGWKIEGYERHGCIDIPAVASLPAGPEKSALIERNIRSWLAVPLWHAGGRIGLLGFDAVEREKRQADDDIALLRTAGEIFANALARERAAQEREALESRLQQAQRMETIGTLAGGIAHDFNNILGAILGYAEMAAGRLRAGSREWQHVQEVRKAGRRAQGVIDQILAFSRRTEQKRRPTRLRPVIEEAVGLLRASLPTTVAIQVRLPREELVVLGEPTRLQQVVMNLCSNAAQAMPKGGTVDLALDGVEVAAERALSHGTLAAGRYVRLAVTDSGHGMDDATLERIFEPFFTTKPAGTGTGLGLATVHGIVADHDGALHVESRPGKGSRFEAYLRRAEVAPLDDDRGEQPLPLGQGETILIVDDEKPLVLLGEEMIAALGYEPVGFSSGHQAIAAFRMDPERFDLVLADEVMPEITGTALAATLHGIRPDLPILLMTGYSGPVDSHRLGAAGIREVLKKPLLSADIAGAIARHLRPPDRPQRRLQL